MQAKLKTLNYTNRQEQKIVLKQIAARLGESPAQSAIGAHAGMAAQSGLFITIPRVEFPDPGQGLPALVDWLRQKGCTTIKYDFIGSYSMLDEED